MDIEIKSWITGEVLFAWDCENNTIKLTLEAAVRAGASLDGASLDGARLDGASLVGASLDGARLDGASLVGASLVGARLDGASLVGASLVGASLVGARLDKDEKLLGNRPIFQIGPIGSRCAYLVAYLTDAGIRIRAGCFFGPLDEFEAAVKREHGDNIHGAEYRAAVALIKAHAELWETPQMETAA